VVSASEARITPSRPRWARTRHTNSGRGRAPVAPPIRAKVPVSRLITPKGDLSRHIEPSSRLLHLSSLALDALRRFQLTPLHIAVAVALVLVVLALITVASATVAFITVAFTVVQPYAVEWP
jgi:hypothetical protein